MDPISHDPGYKGTSIWLNMATQGRSGSDSGREKLPERSAKPVQTKRIRAETPRVALLRRSGQERFTRSVTAAFVLAGVSGATLAAFSLATGGKVQWVILGIVGAVSGVAAAWELHVGRFFPIAHIFAFTIAILVMPGHVSPEMSLGFGTLLVGFAPIGVFLIADQRRLSWFLVTIGAAGGIHFGRCLLTNGHGTDHLITLGAQGLLFVAVTFVFLQLRSEILLRSEAQKAQDQFLASVGHELRTPLTTVVGYADLVDGTDAAGPEEMREYLAAIGQEGRRMWGIVDDLLVSTTAGYRDLAPEMSTLQIGEVVDKAVADTGYSGWTDMTVDAAVLVRAHPYYATMVMRHLLRNAAEHGGGRPALWLEVLAGDRVLLGLTDGGPPIPARIRDEIFEPYVTHGTVREPPRLGLGLPVARRLARAMGGEVLYDADHPRGPSFVFTLQAAHAAATPSKEPPIGDLGHLVEGDLQGVVLTVAADGDHVSRARLEDMGHMVLSCRGPEQNGCCSLLDSGECQLAAMADGILFELDLDVAENREVLHRYRTEFGRTTPVRVLLKPGQAERHRDLLADVDASEGTIGFDEMSDFSKRASQAGASRRRSSGPTRTSKRNARTEPD